MIKKLFNFYDKISALLGFEKEYKNDCGTQVEEESVRMYLPIILTGLTIASIIAWFIAGSINANKENKCIINNIAEFVITAPYAIGCNLFKNRFDIKLN